MQSRLQILLVHNKYQHAGGEDAVFAAEVGMLEARGHAVSAFVVDNRDIAHLTLIQKARVAVETIWSRRSEREISRRVAAMKPIIVHFHNTFPLISPSAYYACHSARIPVVQTLHNFRLLCPNGLFYRDARACTDCLGKTPPWPSVAHACYRDSRATTGVAAAMLTMHRLLGTWDRQVDQYIALTEFMRGKLIEGGFRPEQIAVKPNFVDPDPGVGDHGGRYALFVGRVASYKGVRTLLQAWRRLDGHVPLKIVGEGPLDELALGSPPAVEWLGRQPPARVITLMREASVLVFPSECYEGFPMAIAEAFATGLPVVASRSGAMAEIVQDSQTGLLFTPGNAEELAAKVDWAFAHPNEVADMGWRARKEFEAKYTAERNYRLLCDIYRTAIERRQPR